MYNYKDAHKPILPFFISLLYGILIFLCVYQAFFDFFINKFIGISLVKYTDEIIILNCFIIFLYNLILNYKISRFFIVIIIIIIVFSIGSFLSPFHRNVLVTGYSALIHVKWFICFYLFHELFKNQYNTIKYTLLATVLFSISGIVLNFIFQENFNNFFGIETHYRFHLVRISGFSLWPGITGLILDFLFLFYTFYNGLPPLKKLLINSVLLFLSCMFVGVRIPLIIIPLSFLYYIIFSKNWMFKIFFFISLTLILSILVILLLNNKDYSQLFMREFESWTILSTNSVSDLPSDVQEAVTLRAILQFASINLSYRFFPFGSGVGTFATTFSKDSRVYDDLGLSHLWEFRKMEGVFDNNFASILGETGVLGLLLILGLLFYTYKLAERAIQVKNPQTIHYLRLLLISTLVFLPFRAIYVQGTIACLYCLFLYLAISYPSNSSLEISDGNND